MSLVRQPLFFVLFLLALTPVSLSAQDPAISSGGVVNAANYTNSIAPGAIVSIYGTNLAPRTDIATAVPLPAALTSLSWSMKTPERTTPLDPKPSARPPLPTH